MQRKNITIGTNGTYGYFSTISINDNEDVTIIGNMMNITVIGNVGKKFNC